MTAFRKSQADKIASAIEERNRERESPSYFDRDKLRRLNSVVEAACRNASNEEYRAGIVKARRR